MFIVYICIFKYIHVCIPFCTSLMDVPHLSLAENQYQHPEKPRTQEVAMANLFFSVPPFLLGPGGHLPLAVILLRFFLFGKNEVGIGT